MVTRAACAAVRSKEMEANEAGEQAIRVLLVDDSEHFVRAARRTLMLEDGIEVVGTAGSADQAVEAVRRLGPEVVLMDMSMPGADGLEATRMVKEEAPGLSVIILTAHDTESYEAAARRVGADAVVGKWQLQEEAVPQIRRLGRRSAAGEERRDTI